MRSFEQPSDENQHPNDSSNSSVEIKKAKKHKVINENALSQELFKTIKQQIQYGL